MLVTLDRNISLSTEVEFFLMVQFIFTSGKAGKDLEL